jgi:23S rRNA maturation-related 3'-5' exoribonuclease YhaM
MFIEEMFYLENGTYVNGVFNVSYIMLKSYRNKPGQYISISLFDKTGFIESLIWDCDSYCFDNIELDKLIEIKGKIRVFNQKNQIIIKSFCQYYERLGNNKINNKKLKFLLRS